MSVYVCKESDFQIFISLPHVALACSYAVVVVVFGGFLSGQLPLLTPTRIFIT